MKKKLILLSLVLVFLLFAGLSCVQVGGGGGRGIFKSVDRGEHWLQKVSLMSLKGGENIGLVDALCLISDPKDSGTLYLGTKNQGLFLSTSAGDSWQKIEKLPSGPVNAIAPHPTAPSIVYVAVGNRIFRSGNCCRAFENLYLETKEKTEVTSLVINPFSSNIIYAGLTDGRLLKSENSGYGWNTVYEFKGKIKQILINPKNQNILYVSSDGGGIFKSEDGGKNWFSLAESLKDFSGGLDASKAIFVPAYADALISANRYGLLLTRDGGKTWSAYKLLTSPGKAEIPTLAIDPFNSNVIYYISSRTLYKTIDGGANWITRSLPSKEKITDLAIDPVNSNILYLIYQKTPQTYGF
ncbi:hypothetical protein GW896_02295 [Candidatus Kuenenbacteria bacterium]|nr:hypothetical protein [Candidatus Kuenenbacteria bacterium]